MSLGPDASLAAQELVEAMRATLEARQAGLGANVDLPDVQANFAALSQGIYRIVTVLAETRADAATDAQFWAWVSQVNAWLHNLSVWQQGMTQAFATWSAVTAAEQQLQTAVQAVPAPGEPSLLVPTTLKGRIV